MSIHILPTNNISTLQKNFIRQGIYQAIMKLMKIPSLHLWNQFNHISIPTKLKFLLLYFMSFKCFYLLPCNNEKLMVRHFFEPQRFARQPFPQWLSQRGVIHQAIKNFVIHYKVNCSFLLDCYIDIQKRSWDFNSIIYFDWEL